jgi:hypothetical protein
MSRTVHLGHLFRDFETKRRSLLDRRHENGIKEDYLANYTWIKWASWYDSRRRAGGGVSDAVWPIMQAAKLYEYALHHGVNAAMLAKLSGEL